MTDVPARKRNYHVGMWLFLLVQVIFLIWIIAGAASAHNSADCQGDPTCQSASDAGTAIGVGLVIGLWAAVDIIIGITWLVVHFARRK